MGLMRCHFFGLASIHRQDRGTSKPQALFTQYRQWAAVLERAVVIFCVEADSVILEKLP
jgi:hypothetical protein